MREIKFRGINHETGKFVYGYYTKLLEGIRIIHAIISIENGEFVRYYIHDPKSIGQFTGLYDINGKEVYEGDILKWSDGYKQNEYSTMVKYNESRGMFISDGIVEKEIKSYNSGGATTYNFFIVGNIHENPELLDSNKDNI